MDLLRALVVLSLFSVFANAPAASPSNKTPTSYIIEPCSDGTPNALHFNVTNVPASRVLADIMRTSHMRIKHAERIGNNVVGGLMFPCLEVLPAIGLLITVNADADLVLQKDTHGVWQLVRLKHKEKIATLRRTLGEQAARHDLTGEKQTALLIIAAAENVGSDEAVDDDTPEYLLLIDMALDAKQWDEAERTIRQQLGMLERVSGEETPAYALASVKLARVHERMQKPDADNLLKRSLVLLEKYPDDLTVPALARTYAELAGKAAKADDYATAEDLSARGWAVMEQYDHVSSEEQKWDEQEAFWARVDIGQEEGQLGFGLGKKDRSDDALVHFRRVLQLAEKFGDDTVVVLDFVCDLMTVTSWQDTDLDMTARALLRQLDREEKKSATEVSRIHAKSLFDLAVVRAKQEQFTLAIDAWKKMLGIRHQVLGENDSGAREATYDLALLQRLNGNVDEAVRIEKEADGRLASSNTSARTVSPTLLTQLDRHLGGTLYSAYAQREEALAKNNPIDKTAISVVQRRERMCLDSALHGSSVALPDSH